ncbi:hypothetical protein K2173_022109 [Erythroxylum novogranatense]|uniref:THUMP domain-containing protein n=1 Tax=Erythroxylum novogranatense TaxID=1862640 RepID=A0AAV8TVC7_9ROSI|nr:hypothetical protein K2173_022109 [Erythroxylum novogranatense]
MATQGRPKSTTTAGNKKRKQRYLPNNKPVKKKGSYPLRPGVQGFFITCDGGRERQASFEAINVIESFYEELVSSMGTNVKISQVSNKPLNKKITFTYSDDEEEEEEGKEGLAEEVNSEKEEEKGGSKCENKLDGAENACPEKNTGKMTQDDEQHGKSHGNLPNESEPPIKKQCIDYSATKSGALDQVEEKSIDKLIEEELRDLGDKNKRRFMNIDSGCNGVVFVQMRKRDGDPSPKDIVQYMMTSAASTRKHMSRFILRVLPIEISCYASEEEITRAIAPIVEKYFPVDARDSQKFAVLYEARANTGIDRMKIINAVAKSVPAPHKVDLNNPDTTIVVEIVKTVCLVGVVEKYKELAKYNLRQLTSSKQQ